MEENVIAMLKDRLNQSGNASEIGEKKDVRRGSQRPYHRVEYDSQEDAFINLLVVLMVKPTDIIPNFHFNHDNTNSGSQMRTRKSAAIVVVKEEN